MPNAIINRKQHRMNTLKIFMEQKKRDGEEIDKEKFVNWLIVNYCITRRLALEEVTAVMDWLELNKSGEKKDA